MVKNCTRNVGSGSQSFVRTETHLLELRPAEDLVTISIKLFDDTFVVLVAVLTFFSSIVIGKCDGWNREGCEGEYACFYFHIFLSDVH